VALRALIRVHHVEAATPAPRALPASLHLARPPCLLSGEQPGLVVELAGAIERYLVDTGALVPFRNPAYRPERGAAAED